MRFSSTAILLSGLAAQQAAATWDVHAPKYGTPQNTDNECSDKQKGGYSWGDVPAGGQPGSFTGYDGFNFKGGSGWSCQNSFGKRDQLTKRTFGGKCIKNTITPQKPASFDCGDKKGFSVTEFQVSVEYDTDVEFHYKMPDGSTCKQTAPCKKDGYTVKNTQCGGAKGVDVYLPSGGKGGNGKGSCDIGFHSIGFDCNPGYGGKSSTPSKPGYTPPAQPSKGTETPPKSTEAPSKPGYTPPGKPSETPSKPSESKPGYTPPGKPSESLPGKPSETPSKPSESKPGYTPPSKPSESVPGKPSESVPGKPSESVPGKPSESVPSKPSETPSKPSESKPGYTPPSKPSESVPSKPSESAPGKPSESVPSKPSESAPGKPSESAPGKPSESKPAPTPSSPGSPSSPGYSAPATSAVPTAPGSPSSPSAPGYTAPGSPSSPGAPGAPGYTPSGSTVVLPSGSSPATPPSGPGCPNSVPQCINTWLELKSECKDNTDYSCYCKNPEFTKEVIDCVSAWAGEEVQAALTYLVGICAQYVPQNPGIITNCPGSVPIGQPPATPAPPAGTPSAPAPPAGTPSAPAPPAGTPSAPAPPASYPVPSGPAAPVSSAKPVGSITPAPSAPVPATPVTTIIYQTTVTVPCSSAGTVVPGSSTVTTISTQVTVPQVVFTTAPPAPGAPSSSAPVNLVPGTPAPVPAQPTGVYPSSINTIVVPSGNRTATAAPSQFTGAASSVSVSAVSYSFMGALLAFFAL